MAKNELLLKGLTLEWHGWHSPDTKLLTADRINLFQAFPVSGLRFSAPSPIDRRGDLDRRSELVLDVSLAPLTVHGLAVRVARSDLASVASALGFDLVERPPAGAVPRAGAAEEAPNSLLQDVEVFEIGDGAWRAKCRVKFIAHGASQEEARAELERFVGALCKAQPSEAMRTLAEATSPEITGEDADD